MHMAGLIFGLNSASFLKLIAWDDGGRNRERLCNREHEESPHNKIIRLPKSFRDQNECSDQYFYKKQKMFLITFWVN